MDNMSAIDNAVSLMNSSGLMNKVKAASVYVARQVIIEPTSTTSHAKRMQMAQTVVWNPQQYNVLLQNIIACDPDICTATGSADAITDATLIQKVMELWTPVATMLFP